MDASCAIDVVSISDTASLEAASTGGSSVVDLTQEDDFGGLVGDEMGVVVDDDDEERSSRNVDLVRRSSFETADGGKETSIVDVSGSSYKTPAATQCDTGPDSRRMSLMLQWQPDWQQGFEEDGNENVAGGASQESEESIEIRPLAERLARFTNENVSIHDNVHAQPERHRDFNKDNSASARTFDVPTENRAPGKKAKKRKASAATQRQRARKVSRLQNSLSNGDFALKEIIVCAQKSFCDARIGCQEGLRAIAKEGIAVRYLDFSGASEAALLPKGAVWFLRRPWNGFESFSPVIAPMLSEERHAVAENIMVICWSGKDFVDTFTSQGGLQRIVRQIQACKAARPSLSSSVRCAAASDASWSPRIVLLLEGARDVASKAQKKMQRQKRNRSASASSRHQIAPSRIEDVAAWLYASGHCQVVHASSALETADMLSRYAMCVARAPYYAKKKGNSILDVATKYKNPYTEAQAAKRNNPASVSWVNQLRCVPGVSLTRALRIVDRFPCLRSLVDKCHEDGGIDALKGALGGERSYNKLADRIYRIFTSRNPDEAL